MDMQEMGAARAIAIAKAISAKQFGEAKAEFPQGGEERVRQMFLIEGTVKKGFDTTTKSWPKAKWDLLAAILFSNLNEATRDKIGREYLELLAECETAEEKEAQAQRQKKIKGEAEAWLQTIQEKVVVPRLGTVTAKVEITLVEEAQEIN